ncbi:MAG TPA: response regulator [Burkholderiales bacterium]|nr:response regulator [Burkholderiales bacterium]
MAVHPKRILVVDDHPDAAEALGRVLELMGHSALWLTDPRTAIAAAKEFHPDMALLDINMPYMDGCQLAVLFRAEADLKDVHLVAVTAYGDQNYRRMTRKAGFDAHVQKPAGPEMLQAIIDQFASPD